MGFLLLLDNIYECVHCYNHAIFKVIVTLLRSVGLYAKIFMALCSLIHIQLCTYLHDGLLHVFILYSVITQTKLFCSFDIQRYLILSFICSFVERMH
jgi:hypothetical protein